MQLLVACAATAPPIASSTSGASTHRGRRRSTDGHRRLLHLAQALEATDPGRQSYGSISSPAEPNRSGVTPRRPQWHRLRPSACFGSSSTSIRTCLPRHRSAAGSLPSPTPVCSGTSCSEDAEREIALRGEARYVQRITRGVCRTNSRSTLAVPLRLESRERGLSIRLRFTPFRLPSCGPGEVLIDVKAAGMNFRDVLKALALYPGEAPDARIFGDEVGRRSSRPSVKA